MTELEKKALEEAISIIKQTGYAQLSTDVYNKLCDMEVEKDLKNSIHNVVIQKSTELDFKISKAIDWLETVLNEK